jgi:hypothetical protein
VETRIFHLKSINLARVILYAPIFEKLVLGVLLLRELMFMSLMMLRLVSVHVDSSSESAHFSHGRYRGGTGLFADLIAIINSRSFCARSALNLE